MVERTLGIIKPDAVAKHVVGRIVAHIEQAGLEVEALRTDKGRKVDYDFAASGYALVIVDTGGSHADLNDDYAATGFGRLGRSAPWDLRLLRDLRDGHGHGAQWGYVLMRSFCGAEILSGQHQ